MVTAETARRAHLGSFEHRQLARAAEPVAEQSDLGVEEREEDHRRHRDGRGDGGGEDGPEEADARQLLMGQHGEQQAEDQADRHRVEDEQGGHPQAVQEVVGAEDLLDLRETDVVPRLSRERGREEEGQVDLAEQRVEDEDAEDHERRQQQAEREQHLHRLATTARSRRRGAGRPPGETSAGGVGPRCSSGAVTLIS